MEKVSGGVLLEVVGLSKYYGGLPALAEVGFLAEKGKVTALIGPNGAGKTTLLNCLSGVIRPDCGKILFEGADIAVMQIGRAHV